MIIRFRLVFVCPSAVQRCLIEHGKAIILETVVTIPSFSIPTVDERIVPCLKLANLRDTRKKPFYQCESEQKTQYQISLVSCLN